MGVVVVGLQQRMFDYCPGGWGKQIKGVVGQEGNR